jgi:hypothetical protein
MYTGRTNEREILKINKNSIDLYFPEYLTGKERFYLRKTSGLYYAEYSRESFRKENIKEQTEEQIIDAYEAKRISKSEQWTD